MQLPLALERLCCYLNQAARTCSLVKANEIQTSVLYLLSSVKMHFVPQIICLKHQVNKLEGQCQEDLAWSSAANRRVLEFCCLVHDFLEEDREKQVEGPFPVPKVVCGPLGREMGAAGDSRMALVNLDHLCGQLNTQGERLIHWAKWARSEYVDHKAKSEKLQRRLAWVTQEHEK